MALPASLIIPIPVPSETRNLINPPGEKICITNIPERTGGAMTTSNSLLATLDPQQRAAAEAPEGPVLIMGGPGVGKTHTILARVETLLRKGAPPQAITCVAHDTRCAEDMRRRLVENSEIADVAGQVRFRTMELCALDSLRGGGLETLRLSPGLRVSRPPLKADEIVRLVPPSPIAAGIAPSEIEAIREYIHLVMVGRKFEPGSVPQMWVRILEGYLKERLAQRVLDLDHLIFVAIPAMEKNPDVRAWWQEGRSRHLLVDNFQDITPIQYDLLKLMSGPSGSITVCADPDQSIEMRRGAAPHLVETLREDWPNIDIHHLRLNHRSTKSMVGAANAWASRIHSEGLQTDLQEAVRVEEGMAPTLVGLRNFPEGVSARLVGLAGEVRQLGFTWEDMAIICCDASDIDRVREVLEQHGIPHQTPGDTGRKPDFDARRVINMLAWALNPDDTDAFRGAAFRESDDRRQNMNRRVAGAIITTAQSEGISLVEAADQKKDLYGESSDISQDLISSISAVRDLLRMLDDPGASMQDICQRAAAPVRRVPGDGAEPEIDGDLAVLLRLSNTSWGTDHETPKQNLAWFLDQLNSDLYPDRTWLENQPGPRGAALVTVQEAKGLERKIVFLIDAVDPIRPLHGIFSEQELLAEEDRALYVALTRACDRFYYLGSERRLEEIEGIINPTGLPVPEFTPLESTLHAEWEERSDDLMRSISSQARAGHQYELEPEPEPEPEIPHPGPAEGGRARYPQYELYELIARRLERRQPGDVPSKPKGVGGWEIIIVVSLLTLLGLGALRWLGTI